MDYRWDSTRITSENTFSFLHFVLFSNSQSIGFVSKGEIVQDQVKILHDIELGMKL